LGVAPLLMAAPGFTLQLRLAAKAGQSGVSATILNAWAALNAKLLLFYVPNYFYFTHCARALAIATKILLMRH
jgi:hypothetical protein